MSQGESYEIRVLGQLGEGWSEWLEGLAICHEAGETILAGPLPDQAALYGVLLKIRDLGLPLIAVKRASADQANENGVNNTSAIKGND